MPLEVWQKNLTGGLKHLGCRRCRDCTKDCLVRNRKDPKEGVRDAGERFSVTPWSFIMGISWFLSLRSPPVFVVTLWNCLCSSLFTTTSTWSFYTSSLSFSLTRFVSLFCIVTNKFSTLWFVTRKTTLFDSHAILYSNQSSSSHCPCEIQSICICMGVVSSMYCVILLFSCPIPS